MLYLRHLFWLQLVLKFCVTTIGFHLFQNSFYLQYGCCLSIGMMCHDQRIVFYSLYFRIHFIFTTVGVEVLEFSVTTKRLFYSIFQNSFYLPYGRCSSTGILYDVQIIIVFPLFQNSFYLHYGWCRSTEMLCDDQRIILFPLFQNVFIFTTAGVDMLFYVWNKNDLCNTGCISFPYKASMKIRRSVLSRVKPYLLLIFFLTIFVCGNVSINLP